jgi:hypothetical protein
MGNVFRPDDSAVIAIHDQLQHLIKIDLQPPGGTHPRSTVDVVQLSTFFETAFWASLRSNEGRPTRAHLIFANAGELGVALAFSEAAPYDADHVAKLAAAVPDGGYLAVSAPEGHLQIWGIGRVRHTFWDTITAEIWGPGTIRVGVGPLSSFAILDGRENPVMGGTGHIDLVAHFQKKLHKSLPASGEFVETQAIWRECIAMAQLARAVLSLGHGGAILIVPGESGDWLRSINPFAFRFSAPDTTIPEIIRNELKETAAQGETLQALYHTDISEELRSELYRLFGKTPWGGMRTGVLSTAALSAVDGAVVVTRDVRVLGFGAKISVADTSPPPMCLFQPQSGEQRVVQSSPEDIGGTRHQSAARFVAAHRDTLAVVVSQDRHMSIMHWEPELGAVTVLRNAEWLI